MANMNIYRIDDQKTGGFQLQLQEKMEQKDTVTINRQIEGNVVAYGITLYLSKPQRYKDMSWKWVLDAFEQPAIQTLTMPKAILYVEADEHDYAVTFGNAFFMVDPYCDRDFGFSFARKQRFDGIKTTSLITPTSRRNKTVNTYIDYSELEFDSGESFAKVKGRAKLPRDFALFKAALEVGNSIKVSSAQESLETVVDIIRYIEGVIDSDVKPIKIPVFTKADRDLQATLEEELRASIQENPACVSVSELDIIGVTEVFNDNDSEFILSYGEASEVVSQLDNDTLHEFCKKYGFIVEKMLLDIRVKSMRNGETIRTDHVYDLIEATNDEHRCLLSRGKWYRYNEDYLDYLRDSIGEIEVEYHPEFDFSKSAHAEFIEKKIAEEKDNSEYQGLSADKIRRKIADKYYAERYFNIVREENDGFKNYDRVDASIGDATIEPMDLHRDGIMFAVKKGKSSGKLCYAVDQSLTSLRMYRNQQLNNLPKFTSVGIWLILERNPLREVDGKPDINELNMLLLKNKLDQWKKEVRLMGYRPIIYINYVVK